MKKFALLVALLFCNPLSGIYVGAGFSWNTIDETFHSNLSSNENRSGKDRYDTTQNRLAPIVQLGHNFEFCGDWNIGILAEWKYLNYKTPNVSSSRGQILPNATFSSINFFGPEVRRDFTSKTQLNNEVLLLASVGISTCLGYAYIGLGPAFFTASNRIYVSSVHTPNGVGDHLISTSRKSHKTIWGGAIRLGYEYCLSSLFSIDLSYSYLQTATYRFKNVTNAALLNGFDAPIGATLFLKRNIKFSTQEFTAALNLLF